MAEDFGSIINVYNLDSDPAQRESLKGLGISWTSCAVLFYKCAYEAAICAPSPDELPLVAEESWA